MSTVQGLATCEEELFIIQATAVDLRLQLANLKVKISALETSRNIILVEPSKFVSASASAPASASASAIWQAAGLGKTAKLDHAITAIEDWIFLQPDWQARVDSAGGWLNFLYLVLEVPIKKTCIG